MKHVYKDIPDPTIVQCKICGFKHQSIISHIRNYHNMTIKEYMATYKTKRVRGRKVYTLIRRELYKLKKKQNEPPKPKKKVLNTRCIEYYTKRGLTQEQAKELVSKIQSVIAYAKNAKQYQHILLNMSFNELEYLKNNFDEEYIRLKLSGMINKYKQKQQKEEEIKYVSPGKIKYD